MIKRPTYPATRIAHFVVAAMILILTGSDSTQVYGQSKNQNDDGMFKILDADGDGTLNPYEALDVLLQIESQTDKKITAKHLNQLVHEIEKEKREEFEDFIEQMDQNGDGKIQLDEVDDEMRDFVGMFDQNRDGAISVEEALKAEETMSEEMFLSPEEIDEHVNEIFSELDANKDGVLVENEADGGLSWDQIREGDTDANKKVTPAEFRAFLGADNKRAEFKIDGDVATMEGVINADTPAEVLRLIFEQPGVRTIVMKNVPGSIDDEANLRAARYVRKFGFTTVIKSDGSVASGGTDFFLAGEKRIVENGGKLGIHSWGGPGIQGKDVPKDDPQHQLYLEYYKEMGIPADFYWRTLEAAPVNDIHWMTEEEIKKFNVRSGTSANSNGKGELDEDQFEAIFAELDRNRDGKIQRSEVPENHHGDFDQADENGDDVVTKNELRRAMPREAVEQPALDDQEDTIKDEPYSLPSELDGEARMIMALLDQNSDGKLQQSELEGDARQMLSGVDANGDGEICAEELARISGGPAEDVHSKLAVIDTFQNSNRIVDLPRGIHRGINRHFKKYTNILAPNGQPIHFLAMDGWSTERILRARKVMEHFLQDVPDRQWGDKTELANTMANNHATMILLNDSRDMDRVLPAIEGLNLQLQDLRANESPFEGEDDYMQHKTRDAAYEEVFHLIHGSGIVFAMREYDREIRQLAQLATDTDLWNYDEPNMPGNHFEYIICVYDNYLDLWKTNPTLMEGRRIGKQPKGQSFNGEYKADQRANTRVADPEGFVMIEKFNSGHINYTAELPASFKGTFSIAADNEHRYGEKAKHLMNVTLRGTNANNLVGNALNNRLVGNSGDNILQGNGGDDSLFGGKGSDTVVFRGTASQYTIRRSGGLVEVQDSMVNRDGNDVLSGIEKIKFQDALLDVDSMK